MPIRLSTVQRQTLIAAGRTVKGMVKGVKSSTGLALQEAQLGYYHERPDHIFYLNGKGLRLVQAIEQGGTWNDVEKRYK